MNPHLLPPSGPASETRSTPSGVGAPAAFPEAPGGVAPTVGGSSSRPEVPGPAGRRQIGPGVSPELRVTERGRRLSSVMHRWPRTDVARPLSVSRRQRRAPWRTLAFGALLGAAASFPAAALASSDSINQVQPSNNPGGGGHPDGECARLRRRGSQLRDPDPRGRGPGRCPVTRDPPRGRTVRHEPLAQRVGRHHGVGRQPGQGLGLPVHHPDPDARLPLGHRPVLRHRLAQPRDVRRPGTDQPEGRSPEARAGRRPGHAAVGRRRTGPGRGRLDRHQPRKRHGHGVHRRRVRHHRPRRPRRGEQGLRPGARRDVRPSRSASREAASSASSWRRSS